jgi:YVTN family beta-propeller protein
VLASGVEALNGTGSLDATLSAGPVTVEVALAGYNTYTREMFLDRPTALEVWLDPEGQLVSSLGMLTSAGAPKGVQVTPDGRELWATVLDGPPSIEIWNLKRMRLDGTIDLGTHGAVEILFNADGSKAYTSQMETALVFEIDTATRTVTRTFDTESAWTKVVELSPDERTLYAANWSGDDVSVIDLESGALKSRIPVADTPRGLYATDDGASLYVAGFGGGELQRIDVATGAVTDLFDSDGALRHIVGNAETGKLYISDMSRDCIWLHDMATGTTTKFVDTDEKPNTIDLSPDGRILYVSCRGENNAVSYYIPGPEWGTILLFDAQTATPLDAIVGGNQCTALDVSDQGDTLVFSDFLDARMRVYSVPAFEDLAAGGGGRWEQHFADLAK